VVKTIIIKQKVKDFKQKITQIINIKDMLMIIGLIMVGKGIYMIYPPAAWIVIGGFFIYLGWPCKVVK
jgi:hypothetical protein